MKKVLALVLVLGMASMASAAFQLSVHPTTQNPTWDPMDPLDSEITINISEELIIDVHTPLNSFLQGGAAEEGYYGVVAGPLGSLAGGQGQEIPGFPVGVLEYDMIVRDTPWGPDINPADLGGTYFSFFVFGGSAFAQTAPIIVVDDILFHCEGEGDVEIQLIKTMGDDFTQPAEILDSVIIHQIPEPMTMALLGLGGMALIRRRRA